MLRFRLFWVTFGPTLVRRDRQERMPQQPREEEPSVYGPEAPLSNRGASPGRGWNRPPSYKMSLVWPAGVRCEWPPRWAYLRNQGCRNPPGEGAAPAASFEIPAGGEAPAAPFEIREVEPPLAGVG